MPSQPTIPDIIELAKICQYLASNGVDMDSFFSNGSLDPLLPVKIYDVRKGLEWGHNQNYIAASATGTFLISGTFEVGGIITVEVIDPVLGLITIGTYTIVSGDTTLTLLAQHLAAAITGSGYTATNDGELVIVNVPISLGSTINDVSLIVNYNPSDLMFTIQPFYGGVSLSQQYAWDEDLRNVANYLYRLCNYYIFEAEGVVATNSGQTIYNPNTGQVLNGFVPVDFQFIVGDVDSPLDPTNTFFTINNTRIFAGSLDVHVDGGESPVDLVNQVSYESIYSQNSILVKYNQPLEVGQVVRGQYFKGNSISTGSKVSQPTIYYQFDTDVTDIVFSELAGVPLSDLRLVFRNTTNVRPVNAVVTDMNQLQYDNGALGKFTCPTGDLFTIGNTLTIDYVA